MIPVLLFDEWLSETQCSPFHFVIVRLFPQLNILQALHNIAISGFAIAGLSSKVTAPPTSNVRKHLPHTRLNGAALWTETGSSKSSR